MSVPYKVVSCSVCGYSQWNLILVGSFVWRDSTNREYSIDRELGYCRYCENIVAMERLPSLDEFDKARDAFHASYIRKKFIAARLDRDPLRQDLIADALDPSGGFEVLEAVMSLGRGPVCLRCGADQVEAIPIPASDFLDARNGVPTGFLHPGCGGEFFARGSGGNRIAPSIEKRVYDIFGQLIETIPAHRYRDRSAR